MLLARDKGARIVSIGALVQRPLTSIIALGSSSLHDPADLGGHTVGTSGIGYQSAYLKTIVHGSGAEQPAKEVNVGFDLVRAMLSKKVYATLGGFWNYEGVQLERAHKHPRIIPVDKAGVPTYDELVIVARTSEARNRGELLRRFMQALARGYKTVRADPEIGLRALEKAAPDLDKGLQKASLRRRSRPSSRPARTSRSAGRARRRGPPTRAGWPTTT